VCIFLTMSTSIHMPNFIFFLKKLLNMIVYDFTCEGTSHTNGRKSA
jgi:hypothetical protein